MSEILNIKVPDGSFSAYVARPKQEPAPAVVVLQEIFGVNTDMRQTADELAALGFIAICPDLFWRQVPNVQLSDKTDWDQAAKLYQAYDVNQGAVDIIAAVEWARTLPGATGQVGVVGFCLGGLMSYLTAARGKIDAAVSYYGGRTDEFLDEASNITAPMIMHFGEEDEYISQAAQQAIKAKMHGKPGVDIFSYPGCAHAFARHHGTKFDEAAAHLANGRTASFFKKHLGLA
ncbi:carboxymethylenebutenolidase [Paraburkholderia ginsengiterrae]|uniref:Carboxymethylenebutenolidase n=1 Tax=Paraburkholderia ginsengiterrae TaxID=1462993 RepID=A0A1A9N927_9BURK|nr:dienelactone hydrolase family protein [Paraburkholderia ginsengiterrae]OAJ54853.1 carboxymethylenebutenolidase [Paraburkholderia ginsengiterrae]OAJ61040.1 carboxymethylenebutenolidase [Paraburkholderia ginsengiterrae]